MARKVLYLGNNKWCYTEQCEQHSVLIKATNEYRVALQNQDVATVERLTKEHSTTPEGVAALRYTLTKELTRSLGRKPTIGLDLDGTTGDFTAGLREHMISKQPVKISKDKWLEQFPEPDSYDYFEGKRPWFKSRAEFVENFKAAEVNGIYRTMPILPKAQETLAELKNLGFQIKIVTARTAVFNEDTKRWLKEKAIPHVKLFNTGHAKEQVPDIDVYMEDAPVVIKRLLEHEKKVLTMGQEYNKTGIPETENNIRVKGWQDNVVDNIFTLITKPKK